MALKGIVKWLRNAFGRRLPIVSRQGSDRVRVILDGKRLTLQGERMSDAAGGWLLVYLPAECFWDDPVGVPVSDEERIAITEVFRNKEAWLPGERFEIGVY